MNSRVGNNDSKENSPESKRVTVWLKTRVLSKADWKGSQEASRASGLSDRKLLYLHDSIFGSARGSKVRSELRVETTSEERVRIPLTARASAEASVGDFALTNLTKRDQPLLEEHPKLLGKVEQPAMINQTTHLCGVEASTAHKQEA